MEEEGSSFDCVLVQSYFAPVSHVFDLKITFCQIILSIFLRFFLKFSQMVSNPTEKKISVRFWSFLAYFDSFFSFQENWVFTFKGTQIGDVEAKTRDLGVDSDDKAYADTGDSRDPGNVFLESFFLLFKIDENLVKYVEKS